MPVHRNLHLSPITGQMVHLPQAAEEPKPEPKPKSESKHHLTYANPPPPAYFPFAPAAPMLINPVFQGSNSHMVNIHNYYFKSRPAYKGNQYTFQPSTIPHQYTYQPSTTNHQYTYQPTTTPHQYTYQPTTVPPPPNVSAETHQWPPLFSSTSKTPITMSGALMGNNNNGNNKNDTHRSHHSSPKKEKGKEKEKATKKAVHFTPSVSNREREKQQHQHHHQRHHHPDPYQLFNYNIFKSSNPPLADQKGESKSKDGKTKHKIERLTCEWCREGAQEWFDEGVGGEKGMRLCNGCYRVRAHARARGKK